MGRGQGNGAISAEVPAFIYYFMCPVSICSCTVRSRTVSLASFQFSSKFDVFIWNNVKKAASRLSRVGPLKTVTFPVDLVIQVWKT